MRRRRASVVHLKLPPCNYHNCKGKSMDIEQFSSSGMKGKQKNLSRRMRETRPAPCSMVGVSKEEEKRAFNISPPLSWLLCLFCFFLLLSRHAQKSIWSQFLEEVLLRRILLLQDDTFALFPRNRVPTTRVAALNMKPGAHIPAKTAGVERERERERERELTTIQA